MRNVPVSVALGSPIVERGLRAMPAEISVEDRCKEAMRLCRKDDACFMCATDDEKFKVGLGGLLLFFRDDAETKARIEREIRMLSALSAAMSGVAIDFASAFGDVESEAKPLGLMGMFRESLKG